VREPTLTEEQRELAALLTDVLAKHADSAAVRAAVDLPQGHDPALWSLLCEQVGVPALLVPEEHGGAGFSFAETSVVLERLGHALAPTPMAGTTLATVALLLARDAEASRLLERIAVGETAAVAWAGVTSPPGHQVAEVRESDGTLTGSVSPVLDGDTSSMLLVPARSADGTGLFLVDVDASGVRRAHRESMDQTLRLARLDLDAAPAARLGGDVSGLLPLLHAAGSSMVASLATGAARRGLEATVAYSKEREQFGRPIGSFQALKHRMADLVVLVETSHSAAVDAALAVAETLAGEDTDLLRRTSVAKAWCCEALQQVASETVQLHGGIAITWEHDAHLLLKRAHALTHLFGAPHPHREQVLSRM
jgi:alkylation response protein AidB-like acyl-CoA dehydrogenase